jgi:hypothetical protein
VIPFEEGIIDVRVAVTANPLVNETLLLEALIVNATGVSVGGVGGVGWVMYFQINVLWLNIIFSIINLPNYQGPIMFSKPNFILFV